METDKANKCSFDHKLTASLIFQPLVLYILYFIIALFVDERSI